MARNLLAEYLPVEEAGAWDRLPFRLLIDYIRHWYRDFAAETVAEPRVGRKRRHVVERAQIYRDAELVRSAGGGRPAGI